MDVLQRQAWGGVPGTSDDCIHARRHWVRDDSPLVADTAQRQLRGSPSSLNAPLLAPDGTDTADESAL